MEQITTAGIDLAKSVFSLHGVDGMGRVALRKTVRHVLRLDLGVIRQPDGLNLELRRVAMNLLRPNRCCHGNLLKR